VLRSVATGKQYTSYKTGHVLIKRWW